MTKDDLLLTLRSDMEVTKSALSVRKLPSLVEYLKSCKRLHAAINSIDEELTFLDQRVERLKNGKIFSALIERSKTEQEVLRIVRDSIQKAIPPMDHTVGFQFDESGRPLEEVLIEVLD